MALVNPLQLRRELLIATSDLQRQEIGAHLQSLSATGHRALADARRVAAAAGRLGSVAALVVTTLKIVSRRPSDRTAPRPSLFSRAMSLGRLGFSVWLAVRSGRKP